MACLKNETECAICYQPCAKLSVTCCNGHTICENHYLQRYTAIYEEGRKAFGDDNGQRCFVCRTQMCDSLFSETYFKNLQLVLFQGICKVEKVTPDYDRFYNIVQPTLTKAWNEHWKMKQIKLKI